MVWGSKKPEAVVETEGFRSVEAIQNDCCLLKFRALTLVPQFLAFEEREPDFGPTTE